MARIGIYMLPEYGGFNATFALAKVLQQRGHRIRYFVPQEFADHVTRQGFEIDLYGEVHRSQRAGSTLPLIGSLRSSALEQEDMALRFENWLQRDTLDLLLLDAVVWRALGIALGRGVPVLSLNPTLAAPFSLAWPPLFSRYIPRPGSPGLLSRLRNLWSWLTEGGPNWELRLANRLLAWFGDNSFERLRQSGGRVRWGDYGHRIDVPELVVAPRSLDLESLRSHPDRHYLGTSVDATRKDGAFDWSGYDPKKPLAYCSVGTVAQVFSGRAVPFLSAVIEAFRTRGDWQLIVSCGPLLDGLRREGLPASIRLEKWVPQLEVLERARMFLCHGACGSLREAIYFGVPLLVFPAWGDGFGLSSRVVLHKLGLRGDIRVADPGVIGSLVDALAGRADIAASMEQLKKECREQRELEEGARFIEQFIRERAPSFRRP